MSGAAEFDIIKKYFSQSRQRDDVYLGVGDDCALLQPPAGKQQVVTIDTLVSGVHFPEGLTSAADIAYKTAAVNLSDIAAMGAKPAWAMLALTLPQVDADWLQEFSTSLLKVLMDYGVQLVGGDTTQGPLAISLQLTGFVEPGQAMQRNQALPGDRIYVSGSLGDAALGLSMLKNHDAKNISSMCLQRLNRPMPRVELGLLAAECCRCAIDISDGLLADLGHIIQASQCGATIYTDRLPVSDAFMQYYTDKGQQPDYSYPLQGGDDYELCLTVNAAQEDRLIKCAEITGVRLSCIGSIDQQNGLRLVSSDGTVQTVEAKGFQHFQG